MLVESHGMEAHLGTFLQAYESAILDVFERIHSPKEFTGLSLGTAGNDQEIVLERDDGTTAKLSQISTGQRSALALSIFLALNRSAKDCLDLILIDDPIAHIDDLNGLAFIDYLRNAALAETQVFIATANTKLRKLLEMKFGFLTQDDLQVLEFPDATARTRAPQGT